MCDIWIDVLLQTSALVGPLHIEKSESVDRMSVQCQHMLRGVFELKRGSVTGWTELCRERREMHATEFCLENLKEKPSGRHKHRWEHNIKVVILNLVCEVCNIFHNVTLKLK
jgi:hypothetical protein